MKNGSTPQKSNLPEDQDRLDELMRGPGRNELELRGRLLGKNTLQAGRIIAEEFVNRFGEASGSVEEVVKRLLPAGRATRWEDLDLNINLFCKQYYAEWELVAQLPDGTEQVLGKSQRYGDEEVEFFDRVRFVLYSLPRQKDYKLPEHKAEYTTPSDIARNFVPCFLCWRSVARKPREKKTPLCHSHDLPSTHPEYRRRKRLRVRMLEIQRELKRIVKTPAWVKENTKIHPRDFFASMCISPNGYFPHLVQHLASSGMPLNQLEDIMQALESPVYFDKLSDLMKEAWQFHFDDLGAYFELNYNRLIRAEAWLQAEAEYKHGGKR
ncbi:hypothetical protein LJC46_07955 [Desulfovibrio sp. OttesenSCG-928-G15]|nr:hypothetical protein [Desulfovibrio sp. OttesenSCG-928-G15]